LRAERSGARNKKDTVESRKQLLKKLKTDNITLFIIIESSDCGIFSKNKKRSKRKRINENRLSFNLSEIKRIYPPYLFE